MQSMYGRAPNVTRSPLGICWPPNVTCGDGPNHWGGCWSAVWMSAAGSQVKAAGYPFAYLDVMSQIGFTLLLHERWRHRLGYLWQVHGWRVTRPDTWSDTVTRAQSADVLGRAWREYRRYRSSAIRADVPPR